MNTTTYNKLINDRKRVLFYLNNDAMYWRIKFNHRNRCKRPMNRYSTRQLVAKMAAIDNRNKNKSLRSLMGYPAGKLRFLGAN